MSEKREWFSLIDDVLIAIERIEKSVSDHDNAVEFYEDWESFCAVERNILIIGEAVKRIPKDIKQNYLEIEWKDITGMRNFVVHQYGDVEPDILWDTVILDIPKLKTIILKIKKDHSHD